MPAPIKLHTYATPNGQKASIMLEETGLPYEVTVIDIDKGDQRAADFVAMSPNGKIPVIVDTERNRTVFETGAILTYLSDRTGVFKPKTDDERLTTLQWMLFQVAHVGPMIGQLWHFKTASEKVPYGINRYEREAKRLLGVMDAELGKRAFLAGDYGLADIMTFPWITALPLHLDVTLDATPNVKRWHDVIAQRPAVQRGLKVPQIAGH